MKSGTARCGVFAAALCCASAGAQPALPEMVVVTLFGEQISDAQLRAGGDTRPREERLAEILWQRVARRYIERNGLAATQAEVAELAAYEREFAARDRAQRARKLRELEERLVTDALSAAERARVQDFRDTLARLAGRDAELEREPAPDPATLRETYAPVVEAWKLNRALYQQYGGEVALAPSGPYPRGAWLRLIAEHERRGEIEFFDAGLKERLFDILATRPRTVVSPERVDFTPYWRRPIPPSYFPE